MTMSGGSTLELAVVMVGHSAARRLFMLDSVNIWQDINRIQQIDPVSGEIDLNWSVNGSAGALKVASNDHLLLTLDDRMEEFDADENCICVIPAHTRLRNKGFVSMKSLLLQDLF